jgi:butyryl-CoA dehydrogenase
LVSAKEKPALTALVSEYQKYFDLFIKTTMTLGGALQKGEVEKGLANSAVYLDMMGKIVVAWLWIEMADKAITVFENSDSDEDQQFLAGKLQAAQYFTRWELPKIEHQANLLQGFDETCMAMQADWF